MIRVDDEISIGLRTQAGQADRSLIYQKIIDGDDLSRDDLHLILRVLADGIFSDWAKCVIQTTTLPGRIKGYKVKGSGRRTGMLVSDNSAFARYIQIADDYYELTKIKKLTEAEALHALSNESIERYGVKKKYSYKSIHSLRKKGETILHGMGTAPGMTTSMLRVLNPR